MSAMTESPTWQNGIKMSKPGSDTAALAAKDFSFVIKYLKMSFALVGPYDDLAKKIAKGTPVAIRECVWYGSMEAMFHLNAVVRKGRLVGGK